MEPKKPRFWGWYLKSECEWRDIRDLKLNSEITRLRAVYKPARKLTFSGLAKLTPEFVRNEWLARMPLCRTFRSKCEVLQNADSFELVRLYRHLDRANARYFDVVPVRMLPRCSASLVATMVAGEVFGREIREIRSTKAPQLRGLQELFESIDADVRDSILPMRDVAELLSVVGSQPRQVRDLTEEAEHEEA